MELIHHLKKVRSFLKKLHLKYQVEKNRKDLKVIIGAASTKQDGWISTDYPILNLADGNTFSELFGKKVVKTFLAEHVWEHLSKEHSIEACRNCFTFLNTEGYLRIAVPDGFHPSKEYIDHVKPGGVGPGADDHKILYNYKTLSNLLLEAGFTVRLLEWFDENGRFHYENWGPADGYIERSTRFDSRNQVNATTFTSLIIDATKP